jgi:hypothetical protein
LPLRIVGSFTSFLEVVFMVGGLLLINCNSNA